MEILAATTASGPLTGICPVPGSKSITNRALILAALASRMGPCQLTGALASEDTEVMVESLRRLGWEVDAFWESNKILVRRSASAPRNRLIPASNASLQVANSGTSMRFLTALCSLGSGVYTLDGVERMRERPLGDLIHALASVGVQTTCAMKPGCPPVTLQSDGWTAASISVGGEISSQFLSGLLLAAPWSGKDVEIDVQGKMVSEPYVEMTLAIARHWGANLDNPGPGRYSVRHSPQAYLDSYFIEPDASAASYFWGAAAITGGKILVPGLGRSSLQGDVCFVDVLARMGCEVTFDSSGITVSGRARKGIDVNMNAISDTVMTLGVVALFAEGPTTMRGIGHIRHKETDRIAAIATELRKLGAKVEEKESELTIHPGSFHGAQVHTYRDHRMAMSLALAGLRIPGVLIEDPGCVGKTYPGFFKDLTKLIECNSITTFS